MWAQERVDASMWDTRANLPLRGLLEAIYAVNCPFCLSVWVAGFFWLLAAVLPNWAQPGLLVLTGLLATSRLANFFNDLCKAQGWNLTPHTDADDAEIAAAEKVRAETDATFNMLAEMDPKNPMLPVIDQAHGEAMIRKAAIDIEAERGRIRRAMTKDEDTELVQRLIEEIETLPVRNPPEDSEAKLRLLREDTAMRVIAEVDEERDKAVLAAIDQLTKAPTEETEPYVTAAHMERKWVQQLEEKAETDITTKLVLDMAKKGELKFQQKGSSTDNAEADPDRKTESDGPDADPAQDRPEQL